MTIGELKKLLEKFNDDAIITFSSYYNDHIGTYLVHGISSDIQKHKITYSDYHLDWMVDENPDDEYAEVYVLNNLDGESFADDLRWLDKIKWDEEE